MTKGMMKALTSKARPAPPESGCSDLLLRFFESQFFSAWIAIQCVPVGQQTQLAYLSTSSHATSSREPCHLLGDSTCQPTPTPFGPMCSLHHHLALHLCAAAMHVHARMF